MGGNIAIEVVDELSVELRESAQCSGGARAEIGPPRVLGTAGDFLREGVSESFKKSNLTVVWRQV